MNLLRRRRMTIFEYSIISFKIVRYRDANQLMNNLARERPCLCHSSCSAAILVIYLSIIDVHICLLFHLFDFVTPMSTSLGRGRVGRGRWRGQRKGGWRGWGGWRGGRGGRGRVPGACGSPRWKPRRPKWIRPEQVGGGSSSNKFDEAWAATTTVALRLSPGCGGGARRDGGIEPKGCR